MAAAAVFAVLVQRTNTIRFYLLSLTFVTAIPSSLGRGNQMLAFSPEDALVF